MTFARTLRESRVIYEGFGLFLLVLSPSREQRIPLHLKWTVLLTNITEEPQFFSLVTSGDLNLKVRAFSLCRASVAFSKLLKASLTSSYLLILQANIPNFCLFSRGQAVTFRELHEEVLQRPFLR